MAKVETKTEAPVNSEQLELLRKQFEERLQAIILAVRGKGNDGSDVDYIIEGHALWTPALGEVRALRQGYESAEKRAMDRLEKIDHDAKELTQLRAQVKAGGESLTQVRLGGMPEAMPRAIILPDGMRIVLSRLAAYHPSGDGEIEFKTSDGKTLSSWSAPQHSATGSHDAKTRRTIRDKVIKQLDELFDAMD